ncbi:unnamed protein product [Effrenium voratum]|uniref:B30.2/SPRY domain-containing protein n=1 Tax=Effrenium voratum TaxID=2562239 RepID=A0AA36IBC3_9DINO|nr:unnamed protein product [Effrenium voratum]CAJ1457279.1 unnamed protein product [Effrenium voratum]
MPVQVTLASGKEVEVKTKAGAKVSELKAELGEQLDLNPRSLEVCAEGKSLLDTDAVPDGQVTAVKVVLPWLAATEGAVKDLGGGECEILGEAKGSKINALCDLCFVDGEHYFEVEVLEGKGCWVGVTTKAGFGEGYKMKGLFYGGPGNLSDGGALKTSQFGEGTKKGDVIGMKLDLSDESSVTMGFWENGKYLGIGFQGCERPKGAEVFPAISGANGEKFSISLRRSVRKPPVRTLHPAHGSWELQRLVVNGEPASLDALLEGKGAGKGGYGGGGGFALVMEMVQSPSDPNSFRLSMRVGNSLMTGVTLSTENGVETIKVGMIAGTMMMSPPECQDMERKLSTALPAVTSWKVSGSGKDATLELRGENTELDFKYYDKPPAEPCSSAKLH